MMSKRKKDWEKPVLKKLRFSQTLVGSTPPANEDSFFQSLS